MHCQCAGRKYKVLTDLTARPCEAVGTEAGVGGVSVEAGGTVEAGVGVAGVDVVLAVGPCVAWRTLTAVLVHPVDARAAIQTRADHTDTKNMTVSVTQARNPLQTKQNGKHFLLTGICLQRSKQYKECVQPIVYNCFAITTKWRS